LAGVLSSQDDVELSVFTQNGWKARAWTQIMQRERLTVSVQEGDNERVAFAANPFAVTSDPVRAGRGCDLVILSLPAFLHERYLTALAPHLEDGCVVVGLPGQCGFEFDVRHVLGGVLRHFSVVNFDSLPWICRTVDFGRRAMIAGTKQVITGAMDEDSLAARVPHPVATLQRLLGEAPRLAVSGHLLGITLRSPNAAAHPPMMYSRWKDWDGVPLQSPPLFYEALDEQGSTVLSAVNDELMATAERIMVDCPDVDLSHVIPAYDWEIACYGADISDKTNLMTAVRTNAGYAGILHPMLQLGPEQFAPHFGHRFLTEDIPYGLAVLRGIAQIAGVPTPNIDMVLSWGQAMLEKEYLTAAGLAGRDVGATRSPQRYGFTTLDEVLGGTRARASALPCRVPIA
jgi:hypothetical protein